MYASSLFDHRYLPSLGRLHGPSRWTPKTNDNKQDYLEIDLGQPTVLCAVATQGKVYWVTKYKIKMSADGRAWTDYKTSGQEKIHSFEGNVEQYHVVKHNLQHPVVVKFLRFYPTEYHHHKAMRVEAYGTPQEWRAPLGVEAGLTRVTDGQLSSEDASFKATAVRLYSGSSWCAKPRPGSPSDKPHYYHMQIDLGTSRVITGVVTRGDASKNTWMTAYSVQFAKDKHGWYNVTAVLLSGNINAQGMAVSWLEQPEKARYVRITPRSDHNKQLPCFSLDLLGNAKSEIVPAPKIISVTKSGTVSLTTDTLLTCSIYSDPSVSIQWQFHGKPVEPQPTDRTDSKGITVSRLAVEYSPRWVQTPGTCQLKKSTMRDRRFVCDLEYTCKAFYENAISDGAGEVNVSVRAEINIPKTTPRSPQLPPTKPHRKPKPKPKKHCDSSGAVATSGAWALIASLAIGILGRLMY